MIKRLRTKFICLTMALMAVLLLIILGIICYTTYSRMVKETALALEAAALELDISDRHDEPEKPDRQDMLEPAADREPNPDGMHDLPCFALAIGPNGELEAVGHAYYDLSDQEKLMDILREAQATGEENGILWHRNLHFLRCETQGRIKYVFTDIASQRDTLSTLLITCILIFIATMGAFWVISWWLSKWMVRPVEQAWAQQKQFIADASHELKTPLTVILTNAEMLQSQEFGPEASKRLTDGIATMAGQMRGLTEGLLELARSDNRPDRPQRADTVHLSQLTEQCVMYFEPVYFEAERELHADVRPGIYVRGDARHLQQVVDILLDNGRKYSTPGTQVELTLTQNRAQCTLRVSSRGTTLTAQQCKDIFQRFYRVDESRSRTGSCGLGLSIAEAMVREHRGRIWAQGKDGVNTFFVTLPTCDGKK